MINDSLVTRLKDLAREAGRVILQVYEQEDLGVQHKSDATPVTVADIQANDVIVAGLSKLDDSYPILSEESAHTPYQERKNWQRYWLVDPLDGTQEFINGNGQFTVNIALMEGHYPLFGMVHTPVTNTSYWGGQSLGAFKQIGDEPVTAIRPRALDVDKEVVVLGSRSYGTARAAAFVDQLREIYPNLLLKQVGSALKSCHIAEGIADIYPRLGPTSEWDTAAVQAVLEGAGGLLLNPEGDRFCYNTGESLLNPDFLVLGDSNVNWRAFWNHEAFQKL